MSETMADFEKELEASFRKLNEGDVVEGVITGVDENAVYLDINYHAQGVVRKEDYSDDPSFSLQSVPVGDTVKAVVLSDDDGEGNVSWKDCADLSRPPIWRLAMWRTPTPIWARPWTPR